MRPLLLLLAVAAGLGVVLGQGDEEAPACSIGTAHGTWRGAPGPAESGPGRGQKKWCPSSPCRPIKDHWARQRPESSLALQGGGSRGPAEEGEEGEEGSVHSYFVMGDSTDREAHLAVCVKCKGKLSHFVSSLKGGAAVSASSIGKPSRSSGGRSPLAGRLRGFAPSFACACRGGQLRFGFMSHKGAAFPYREGVTPNIRGLGGDYHDRLGPAARDFEIWAGGRPEVVILSSGFWDLSGLENSPEHKHLGAMGPLPLHRRRVAEEWRKRIGAFIRAGKAEFAGSKVLFRTMYNVDPTRKSLNGRPFGWPHAVGRYLQKFNEISRVVAEEEGVGIFDTARLLEEQLPATYLLDHIHPNAFGKAALGNFLVAVLEEQGGFSFRGGKEVDCAGGGGGEADGRGEGRRRSRPRRGRLGRRRFSGGKLPEEMDDERFARSKGVKRFAYRSMDTWHAPEG